MSSMNRSLLCTCAVILLCLMVFTLQGCGMSASPDVPPGNTGESIASDAIAKLLDNQALDQDLREILSAKPEMDPPTSFELIDQYLADGLLKREDAVLLKITAAFNPEKLAPKYKGAPIDPNYAVSDDLRRDIQWVMNHFDELDKKLQEKLRPFILRPDESGSFFNPANAANQTSILEKLALVRTAHALETPWQEIIYDAPGRPGAVSILYKDGTLTTDSVPMVQKALIVKEALEKSWPMFKGLLDMQPAEPFKLYITDLRMATSGLAGAAHYVREEGILLETYISVDWSLSEDMLKSVVAHELFHIFQYYCMEEYEQTEAWWLQEATAVWAEDFVYPDLNMEHRFLNKFFRSLSEKMMTIGKLKDYSSYMFFFFLSEWFGDDQFVPDIILSSRGLHVSEQIMNIPDFPSIFAEYALANWNRYPWKRYSDYGTFPNKSPYGPSLEKRILQQPEEHEEFLNMEAGGIQYIYYHLDSEQIKKVKFDFADIEWYGDLHGRALYKVGDQWSMRDFTDQSSLVFCLDRPTEDVKAVVLIFSNADLMYPQEINYTVDTIGECPKAMPGITNIVYEIKQGDQHIKVTMESEDLVVYNEEKKAYVLTERNISYNFSSKLREDITADGSSFEFLSVEDTGSGSLYETYDVTNGPIKFKIGTTSNPGYINIAPRRNNQTWVTYTKTITMKLPDNNYTDTVIEKDDAIFPFADELFSQTDLKAD
jgi:hypothetical protein